MHFYVDDVFYRNKALNVIGVLFSDASEEKPVLSVTLKGKEVPFELTWGQRPDVGYAFFHDPTRSECGIFLVIPAKGTDVLKITGREMQGGQVLDEKSFTLGAPVLRARNAAKNTMTFAKNKLRVVYNLLRPFRHEHAYTMWFQNMRTAPYEIEKERREPLENGPLFSILTPVFRTPVRYLNEMISSVVNQSYPKFELLIVNADPSDRAVKECLEVWEAADPRIRVKDLPENLGIAGNTNEALRMAAGDYIAMLDHDDTLEYDALYEYAKEIIEKPETGLLYCDEDKMKEETDYYFYPNFKPDFNPHMLFSNNYICHFLAVKRSLAEEVGGWDEAYNGAQDFDFILKCTERTREIVHVPKVLYHWRSFRASTSRNMKNKDYAIDAGARAINASYRRRGIPAEARPAKVGGWYESHYTLKETPLVSVLIPNKDHTDDLDKCIRSLMTRASYQNLEIIIIENNSTEEETFRYYERIEKEFEKVRTIYYKGGFNYSAINNFGVREAKGDVLLLLNNDTELITSDLFESMLGYLEQEEVGMVGAKLLYADDTIQHAGVLMGAGGLADHMFKGKADSVPEYMCRAIMSYDVSAVTGACLMIRKKVYEEVGGLDESLAVAFNDVDFCLKVREAGYLIVYDAQAKMHHYESKSRGMENTPEKFVRFGKEASYINGKWKILIDFADPYYNPNMSYISYFKPDEMAMLEREKYLRERFMRWGRGEA